MAAGQATSIRTGLVLPATCMPGDLFDKQGSGLYRCSAVNVWTQVGAGGPGGEAFPVGSVFIAVVSTNPNTLLGYGTWQLIAAGRALIGINPADPDFDTVEEVGGSKTVFVPCCP